MSAATVVKEGPPIGVLHEVRATFASPDSMQAAVSRLETSGFDRADLSLPEIIANPTPETSAKPVDTEPDARQARTLHVSGAAAVLSALVAGGIVHLLSTASNEGEQTDRAWKAATGTLVLSVRTPNAEKRMEAEAILRSAGGSRIEVQ